MTQTKPNSRRWLALMLLCAAQFMMILDLSIVKVARSALDRDLGCSPQHLQWMITVCGHKCGSSRLDALRRLRGSNRSICVTRPQPKHPPVNWGVFRLQTLVGANPIGLLMNAAVGATIFILTL